MNLRGNWQLAISKLRKAHDATAQMEQMQYCIRMPLRTPSNLVQYHDALLFICAYPYSAAVYELACTELKRLAVILNKHEYNKQWKNALTGSGLPFTEIQCQYSAAILSWLLEKFPERVKPVAADDPGEALKTICMAALPQVEFYLSSNGKQSLWNRVKSLSGFDQDIKALKWLLQLFRQQQWNGVLQDHLYDSLKIFVRWMLQDDRYCRSFLRWPVNKLFLRKTPAVKLKPLQIVRKQTGGELCLMDKEKEELLSIIRSSLAFCLRETDPVTYASTSETHLYDMGDGLQIALTGMVPQRQLAIESYIGFMAFKNGIPVSYGGGWLFGYRCKIGINIYAPFRGGGSERLFCEVMRLYHQRFNIRKFVVAPYQFGKGNPEGLKSGAYWFYYKTGFRSADKLIAARAENEWQKVAGDKNHRSPVPLLKQFTSCALEWEPVKVKTIFIDADALSKAVTAMINKKFAGNRETAIAVSARHLKQFCRRVAWPLNETAVRVWQNWSLIFYCLPDTGKWTRTESRQFITLLLLKATGKEKEFTDGLQKYKPFWKAADKFLS